MSDDFYTYELAYPEIMGGTVFYVGMGSGHRIDDHEKDARKGVESLKCDIIRQIWQVGYQIVKRKVYENISRSEAYAREGNLINKYGCENLANWEGWLSRRKKPLVQVSFSGELRILVEEAMQHDGIPFTRESFQDYVKSIVEVECKHKMKLFCK